jgi:putative transposase
LTSYGGALQRLPELGSVGHLRVRSAARVNHRVEQSHLPTRLRERRMQGFRSINSAQHFLSLFSGVCTPFRPRRHLLTAEQYRTSMQGRFRMWNEITGIVCA